LQFSCLCCGHRTLTRRPGYSHQLCDVCCFEDRLHPRGQLAGAQAAYAALGVVDPELRELARAARPEEAPPSWFLSLEEAPGALLTLVFEAFGDQDLAGGVCLAEAEHIDDYALPSRDHTEPPPAGFGASGPWHELTRGTLDAYHWCPFSFMDARGLRYYTPAYIRYFLVESDGAVWESSFLFMLESSHRIEALISMLTPDQRYAVARYLAYLTSDPGGFWAEDAQSALRRWWGRYLDPDHLSHVIPQ